MKLIFKKTEIFLLAMGLIFLSAIILINFFPHYFFQQTSVIFVSESEHQKLISQSENTSVIININTATAEELTAIRGIGAALAQKIVDYRQEHGSFDSVDELINIEGIGRENLKQIAPYVTVG